MWVRYGAVGFVAAVARSLNIADVHCNLLPVLQPFLKQPVVQVDQEVSPRIHADQRASPALYAKKIRQVLNRAPQEMYSECAGKQELDQFIDSPLTSALVFEFRYWGEC